MTVERVDEIIDRYGADATLSLAILQSIQGQYNYLPREALEHTAERLGIPLSEVYRLATFYRSFSLQPRGEYVIKVCLGTACHLCEGWRTLEQLERELGIRAGGTTSDGKFSLEATGCLGACAQAPLMVVNEQPYVKMSYAKARQLIARLASGEMQPGDELAELTAD